MKRIILVALLLWPELWRQTAAADAPLPPAFIAATQGTFDSKVLIYWTASPSTGLYAAAKYEVLRGTTFNWTYAGRVTIVIAGTNYDDTTTTPGVDYYYWVRPISLFDVTGNISACASGYQALSPPQNVQATAGTHTGRVAVTWAAADGAFSYNVYRAAGAADASLVYSTDALAFNDTLVASGVDYHYQVRSVRGPYASALSAETTGRLLDKATGVSASKGSVVNQVTVAWNAVSGATAYEVWRGGVSSPFAASQIGETTGASFADTSAQSGVVYYYWVKAKSSAETSGWSESAYGYAAVGAIDLSLSDLIMLPRVLPAGAHPAVVSCRLRNGGPAGLTAPNTALRFSVYMGQAPYINLAARVGTIVQDVTLAANTNALVVLNAPSGIVIPSAPGYYYVFLRAETVWPNLLANQNPDSSVMKAGVVRVTPGGQTHYWTPNDYNGDGRSDMAVYAAAQAAWSIRTIDSQVLWANGIFGAVGYSPTVGDYDGDRKADPAVYDAASGLWSAMLSAGGYATATTVLNIVGGVAMPGDYDGDGKADPAAYDELSGIWSARISGSGYAAAALQFGGQGYRAAPGDYNGDGQWDLALYQEATGAWYIRTPGGTLLKWGEIWGGPGYRPVSGDFDGDGIWDLGLYNQQMGYWMIKTMAGTVLEPAVKYSGGPGWLSVSGDFDGDGIADLVVYNTASGHWYAFTMAGVNIINAIWGSASTTPVQWP